jgi:hypothetical protein
MRETINLKYENDEGEEVTLTLPAKMEVCDDCGGHGYTLRGGMRGAAYTMEEFNESFDEEDREEYFRHGGKYDEQCQTCHGKNVVPAVDEDQLSPEQKKQYEEYEEHANRMAQLDADARAEEAAERRMGC